MGFDSITTLKQEFTHTQTHTYPINSIFEGSKDK